MIMEILNLCMRKECRLYTVKEGYRLGEDIQSKVLAFAFGLSAEIERNLISQRTREALVRKRSEGKQLGRPQGTGNRQGTLDRNRDFVYALLDEGVSRKDIAYCFEVSPKTLYNWFRKEQKREGENGL